VGNQIKAVAARSRFNAPTLRYYEDIGLLPASERTPAGCRVYDDRALARSALIARARQLGCSLEDRGPALDVGGWPLRSDPGPVTGRRR
jgi:DNA-binding transcriptional MerR regulator